MKKNSILSRATSYLRNIFARWILLDDVRPGIFPESTQPVKDEVARTFEDEWKAILRAGRRKCQMPKPGDMVYFQKNGMGIVPGESEVHHFNIGDIAMLVEYPTVIGPDSFKNPRLWIRRHDDPSPVKTPNLNTRKVPPAPVDILDFASPTNIDGYWPEEHPYPVVASVLYNEKVYELIHATRDIVYLLVIT